MKRIFGAESVGIGHPDKVADQISDAILDAFLERDPKARVACETLIVPSRVVLAGEITSKASIDFEKIVKEVLLYVGYKDAANYKIENYIQEQSPDIAQAVNRGGAGDQGMMIGYATDETDTFMPLPVVIAHKLIDLLFQKRKSCKMPFLGSDAKSLVEVSYEGITPKAIETIILSTQHTEEISEADLQHEITKLILNEIEGAKEAKIFVNPGGRFVLGGPKADSGMTGRKQMVDSYGSVVRHGGGAFSGKDATKVDRSAAYLARYIAKNIVASKQAKRCEVTLTYAMGMAFPVSLSINTFGTSKVSAERLEKCVREVFLLDVAGLISMLSLTRPIFRKTAYGGHFGRDDPDFTWEQTDKAAILVNTSLE
jgi:S-adenosylmethionine synthetase